MAVASSEILGPATTWAELSLENARKPSMTTSKGQPGHIFLVLVLSRWRFEDGGWKCCTIMSLTWRKGSGVGSHEREGKGELIEIEVSKIYNVESNSHTEIGHVESRPFLSLVSKLNDTKCQ